MLHGLVAFSPAVQEKPIVGNLPKPQLRGDAFMRAAATAQHRVVIIESVLEREETDSKLSGSYH